VAKEGVQRPWWRKLIRRGTMQEEREEREQYMDSLEQQMEEQREQIQCTLDRMAEDQDLDHLAYHASFLGYRKVYSRAARGTPGLP
jgi:hypothetical protein